jgi:hypothetical protein
MDYEKERIHETCYHLCSDQRPIAYLALRKMHAGYSVK